MCLTKKVEMQITITLFQLLYTHLVSLEELLLPEQLLADGVVLRLSRGCAEQAEVHHRVPLSKEFI